MLRQARSKWFIHRKWCQTQESDVEHKRIGEFYIVVIYVCTFVGNKLWYPISCVQRNIWTISLTLIYQLKMTVLMLHHALLHELQLCSFILARVWLPVLTENDIHVHSLLKPMTVNQQQWQQRYKVIKHYQIGFSHQIWLQMKGSHSAELILCHQFAYTDQLIC